MHFFPCAHAGHPLWQHATKQVVVQLSAQINIQQLQDAPCLGVVYLSTSYAPQAADVVSMLSQALPQVQHWVGCTGHAVIAGDMDYGDTGSIAVMLLYIPAQQYRVFSGIAPQLSDGFVGQCALVHGDAASGLHSQHLGALMQQLQCPHMVGGLNAWPTQHAQWAWGDHVVGQTPASMGGGGVQTGGFSGVAFGAGVECLTVSMQACRPQGSSHVITKMEGDIVLELDGKCALEVMRSSVAGEMACALAQEAADTPSAPLVAIAPAGSEVHSACIAPYARVLRVVGVDAQRQGIVLQGHVQQGQALTLCAYDEHAARGDTRRACAQVWETLTCDVVSKAVQGDAAAATAHSICGAIYIRNRARQSVPSTPQVDAELQLIRHALGPVPLLGFTSSHEVDGAELQHLSAQLLVFTQPLAPLS